MTDVHTIPRHCPLGPFGNKDGGWPHLGVAPLTTRLKTMLPLKGSPLIDSPRAEQRGCIRGGSPHPPGRCPPADLSSAHCHDSLHCLRMVIKRPTGGLGRRGQGPHASTSSPEKALSTQTFVTSSPSGFWSLLVNQTGCRPPASQPTYFTTSRSGADGEVSQKRALPRAPPCLPVWGALP